MTQRNMQDVNFVISSWYVHEQTFEQTIEMPVIWDAITLIMTSLLYLLHSTAYMSNDVVSLGHQVLLFRIGCQVGYWSVAAFTNMD